MAATKLLGSFSFKDKSLQPVFASTNKMRSQWFPPSTVLYTPLSACGPCIWPMAAT